LKSIALIASLTYLTEGAFVVSVPTGLSNTKSSILSFKSFNAAEVTLLYSFNVLFNPENLIPLESTVK